MPRLTVPSRLFSPLAQRRPLATRGGDFLFLSGQTPHDPGTGSLITTLGEVRQKAKDTLDLTMYESLFDKTLAGPIAAQTFTILSNIQGILFENGMSMDSICKMNIYLRDGEAIDALRKVWERFFPKPSVACSVVEVSSLGMNPRIQVMIDCIAALPDRIAPVHLQAIESESRQLGFGRCAAVKAGDLIFVSGHIGVDDHGRAILTGKEVSKEAEAFIRSQGVITGRSEATMAQAWKINAAIESVLKQLGSSGDHILIQNFFARTMRPDLYRLLPVNRIFYPEKPPAGTGFGYSRIGADENLRVQVEVIATVPGKKEAFAFDPGLTKPTTHYSMATKAGPYIFLSGRAGINWQKDGDPIVSADDLTPWQGQHIMVGRPDEEKPVFLQAWYCYEAIRKIVNTLGAGLEDVVKTNVFVADVGDLPLVERARNYFFGESLPAETVIPISQATMHRELVVEVEPILVLDR